MPHPCLVHEQMQGVVEGKRAALAETKGEFAVKKARRDVSRCEQIDQTVNELLFVLDEVIARMEMVKHGLRCKVCLGESRREYLEALRNAA